jgi:O-methyltransferase
MNPTQIISYLIYATIAIALWMLLRFLWLSIRQRVHQPDEWIQAAQHNEIPPQVLKYENRTPDKIRVYNFWFQIRRILNDQIPGDFAELGVYKGESAWLIHQLAPEKQIHLFDTFKGFAETDLSLETGKAATYGTHDFADTDVEVVMNKLNHTPKAIIHAGYFPDTTKGLEKKLFAFVNIDADLYAPVKAGLNFFYPRLAPGGVIIIHDYSFLWDGLRKAVDEFISTIPEQIVHVPDKHGSVMIIKNK